MSMDLFDIEDCDDSSAMPHLVEHQTDRRSLLSGAGFLAASVLSLAPVAALADDGDVELIRLGARLDAAWIEQAALERAGGDIAESHGRAGAIVNEIELLSATTLAGLLVKARACSWCHGGEPFDPDYFAVTDHPTTDMRLAASVFRDLLTIGGKPVPYVA